MATTQQRIADALEDAAMSLRDKFAAAALQGLLASDTRNLRDVPVKGTARAAYTFADAMLEVRLEEKP
jgi:hypothetical protein